MSNVLAMQRGEKNAFKSLGTGNRIATTLFYVSKAKLYLTINNQMLGKVQTHTWIGPIFR